MEDTIVSFEVAKLAKEKGFTDVVGVFRGKHYYNYKGELDADQMDYLKAYVRQEDTSLLEAIAAPTQSLLQKWLREVHNITIVIDFVLYKFYKDKSKLYFVDIYCLDIEKYPMKDGYIKSKKVGYESCQKDHTYFETYELALEAGLLQALKLI